MPLNTRKGRIDARVCNAMLLGLALLIVAPAATAQTAKPTLEQLLKRSDFGSIKISPDGTYFAATIDQGDSTDLVMLDRATRKPVGGIGAGKNRHVVDFWWVSPDRLILTTAEKIGRLDTPRRTGELFTVQANGKGADLLVGQRLQAMTTGTRLQPKKNERIAADMVDSLPGNDTEVVISASSFGNDPSSRAEVMDVRSGRRNQVAKAPVPNASFQTDNSGAVRAVYGVDASNGRSRLYLRDNNKSDWKLVNDESRDKRDDRPIGFSADNKTLYVISDRANGPDVVVAVDTSSLARKTVLEDKLADPGRIIYRQNTEIPVGVQYLTGKPYTAFLDDSAPEARTYRSLEAAFKDGVPFVTSSTTDGSLALVQLAGDRLAPEYYLFDTRSKKADLLLQTRNWLDPAQLPERKPISLKTRDGLELHGYLTVPRGTDKNLPLVVNPHGGPFGIADDWYFDPDTAILANAGYAVLQVNFRGSGGQGKSFEGAGAQQWGKAMQDDLTDATQWAIKQGVADPKRICIYGASYGGYASLMGVAREPDLYRCAAGYVGVYDLSQLSDSPAWKRSKRLDVFVRERVGQKETLAEVSPVNVAGKIKVPVFLAAGGEDMQAPIKHTRAMEAALRKANVPVETLYYKTEGHGFYQPEHQVEYYQKLLAFLDRNIGSGAK